MSAFQSLLTPVLALAVWSLVMWVWSYVHTYAAVRKAGLGLEAIGDRQARDQLPPAIRKVADNYSLLLEQPVLFYALVFYSYLAGQQNGPNLTLAWAYAALRIAHSLIHATINNIPLRYATHILGTLALAALAGRDVMALLG